MNSEQWNVAASELEQESDRLKLAALEYREKAAKGEPWPVSQNEITNQAKRSQLCESQPLLAASEPDRAGTSSLQRD